jgi:hypothetical protein
MHVCGKHSHLKSTLSITILLRSIKLEDKNQTKTNIVILNSVKLFPWIIQSEISVLLYK